MIIKIDTVTKQFPTVTLNNLLIVGEKNIDFVEFTLDRFYGEIDLSTAVFTLLANINTYAITQILSSTFTDTTITLKWTIDENFTSVSGEMGLEIKAITDTEVIKCLSNKSFKILSGNSLGTTPPPPILDVITGELADHEVRIKYIEENGGGGGTGTNGKSPYIGVNGNWYDYNDTTKLWVDTGVKAQSVDGKDGADGATGATGGKGETGSNGADGIDGTDGYTPVKGTDYFTLADMANIATKSTASNATLSSATWIGSTAPYSYTLTLTGVTTTNAIEVIPQSTITVAQEDSLALARISNGTQSANSITLLAFGTKPTVDIPLTFIVRGDL